MNVLIKENIMEVIYRRHQNHLDGLGTEKIKIIEYLKDVVHILKNITNLDCHALPSISVLERPNYEDTQRFQSVINLTNQFFDYFDEINPIKTSFSTFIKDNDSDDFCSICESPLMDTIDSRSCVKCGASHKLHISSDMFYIPFKEVQLIQYPTKKFQYKRMNHMIQIINQLESKNYNAIPQNILDKFIIQLKRENITDLSKLDVKTVRLVLKKMKLNTYYKDSYCLLRLLLKLPPIVIENDVKERIINMFHSTSEVFDRIKGDRKSFLSYHYLIYKLLEILNVTECLGMITLLKSTEKLKMHDGYWRQICDINGWPFKPTR